MKLRITSIALVLALAPPLSAAAGCDRGHEKQAQSCAAGTVFDANTGSCVTDPTTS